MLSVNGSSLQLKESYHAFKAIKLNYAQAYLDALTLLFMNFATLKLLLWAILQKISFNFFPYFKSLSLLKVKQDLYLNLFLFPAEPAARDLGWTSGSSRSTVLSISLMSFVLLCQQCLL